MKWAVIGHLSGVPGKMGVLPVTCVAHGAVIFTAALEVVAAFASQLQPHLLCWFLMICNQSDKGLDRTLIKTTEL